MVVKLTKYGPRRYIQLVEAYRDEDGRARQPTVASLGRLESIDQHFESVVRGLEHVTGRQRPLPDAPATRSSEPEIAFEPARHLGDV